MNCWLIGMSWRRSVKNGLDWWLGILIEAMMVHYFDDLVCVVGSWLILILKGIKNMIKGRWEKLWRRDNRGSSVLLESGHWQLMLGQLVLILPLWPHQPVVRCKLHLMMMTKCPVPFFFWRLFLAVCTVSRLLSLSNGWFSGFWLLYKLRLVLQAPFESVRIFSVCWIGYFIGNVFVFVTFFVNVFGVVGGIFLLVHRNLG